MNPESLVSLSFRRSAATASHQWVGYIGLGNMEAAPACRCWVEVFEGSSGVVERESEDISEPAEELQPRQNIVP